MSKRYSGKSFKDSSVKKKTKIIFKREKKIKKRKTKKDRITNISSYYSSQLCFFLSFQINLNQYNGSKL